MSLTLQLQALSDEDVARVIYELQSPSTAGTTSLVKAERLVEAAQRLEQIAGEFKAKADVMASFNAANTPELSYR